MATDAECPVSAFRGGVAINPPAWSLLPAHHHLPFWAFRGVALAGQVSYEDIVAEQGASDEYRAQLARVRARLAAARAAIPSVIPSQEKVVLVRTVGIRGPGAGTAATSAGGADAATWEQGPQHQQQPEAQPGATGTRIMAVTTAASGTYRYTTLEDTRRLIDATRPYDTVGVS